MTKLIKEAMYCMRYYLYSGAADYAFLRAIDSGSSGEKEAYLRQATSFANKAKRIGEYLGKDTFLLDDIVEYAGLTFR